MFLEDQHHLQLMQSVNLQSVITFTMFWDRIESVIVAKKEDFTI
jgi:hypothetical protein